MEFFSVHPFPALTKEDGKYVDEASLGAHKNITRGEKKRSEKELLM